MKKSTKIIALIACIAIAVPLLVYNFVSLPKTSFDANTTNIANSHISIKNQETQTHMNENLDKSVLNVSSHFDFIYDFSNNKTMSEISDYIALVRIESIDGVTNVSRKTNKPVITPYSYGQATVVSVLKGEISSSSIGFTRCGGQMPYDEWIKGDVDPDKLNATRAEAGLANVPTKDIIVNYKLKDDIELEIGKTYLVFMCRNEEFNLENEYIIQGFQYGLRELQQTNVSSYSVQNSTSLKVKNNMTGEWESLSDVVYLDETELS